MTFWLVTALLVGQADGVAPVPAAGWKVSTGRDAKCFITRTVAVSAQPWTIEIHPSSVGASYDLFVAAPKNGMRTISPGSPPTRIAIDAEAPFETFGWTQDTADGRRVLRSSLSLAWVDAARDGGTMTIAAPKLKVAVPADGIAAALKSLKSCHADRLRGYGLDPALWFDGRLAKPNNPGRFFGADAYPTGAPPGRVTTLLLFDPAGRATRCVTVEASNALLATGTCGIALSKMTATMPTGADGQPVASYALFNVVWSR